MLSVFFEQTAEPFSVFGSVVANRQVQQCHPSLCFVLYIVAYSYWQETALHATKMENRTFGGPG